LEEVLPLSEAFEKHAVWFLTDTDPGRNTYVSQIYVFENEEATVYSNLSSSSIEDIIDLTDEEIVQYAEENATRIKKGTFSLDITLDRLGQNTEQIDVIFEGGKQVNEFPFEDALADRNSATGSEVIGEEEYRKEIEADETREIEDDIIITTTEIDYGSRIMTLGLNMVQQTIFDTTYAGLQTTDEKREEAVLTHVDESFNGFKLDDPDTDKENVTIEEAEERKEQMRQEEQNQESESDLSVEEAGNKTANESDALSQDRENKQEPTEDDVQKFADETERMMKLKQPSINSPKRSMHHSRSIRKTTIRRLRP